MLSLDKKNLPAYIFKLNVAMVTFFALWFTVGVAAMVATGCVYGESVITYAVMGGVFALFFIALAIFLLIEKKLYKRLVGERAAQMEKEFADIPLEKAAQILTENRVINENGFICAENEVFGETAVPFGDACFAFGFYVEHTKIVLNIAVGRKGGDEACAILALDGALYNFLTKKGFDLSGSYVFDLFINDKKKFAELLLNQKIKFFV
ncbi:MAG: hypothetical protein K2L67_03335 [Clostridia bacterium]|nr:hypothetical protein [Clostridia bacterium]